MPSAWLALRLADWHRSIQRYYFIIFDLNVSKTTCAHFPSGPVAHPSTLPPRPANANPPAAICGLRVAGHCNRVIVAAVDFPFQFQLEYAKYA